MSIVITAAIGANAAIAVVVSNAILSNNTNRANSPVYAPNAQGTHHRPSGGAHGARDWSHR